MSYKLYTLYNLHKMRLLLGCRTKSGKEPTVCESYSHIANYKSFINTQVIAINSQPAKMEWYLPLNAASKNVLINRKQRVKLLG